MLCLRLRLWQLVKLEGPVVAWRGQGRARGKRANAELLDS